MLPQGHKVEQVSSQLPALTGKVQERWEQRMRAVSQPGASPFLQAAVRELRE